MDNYLFDIDKSTAIYGAWPWLRTFRTHPMMFASLIGHVSQAPFVFVIGPVGIVAAWVTLLYAVGLREVRRCEHWSERYGEPRFWTRFREGRSRHSRLHPDHRPCGATTPLGIAVSSGDCGYAIAASFPHRKVAPSIHMRCMMTASLRAIATRVRRRPLVRCSLRPQALRADHRCVRPIKAFAAA